MHYNLHIPARNTKTLLDALVVGGADDPLSSDFRFHSDRIRFLESDPEEPADQAWRDRNGLTD